MPRTPSAARKARTEIFEHRHKNAVEAGPQKFRPVQCVGQESHCCKRAVQADGWDAQALQGSPDGEFFGRIRRQGEVEALEFKMAAFFEGSANLREPGGMEFDKVDQGRARFL